MHASSTRSMTSVISVTPVTAVTLAVPLFLAVLCLPARTQEGPPDEFDDQDALPKEGRILEIVRSIEEASTPDLWPGFRPSTVPVALFDGRRTWLHRHPAPPEEFRPHPGREDLHLMEGRHPAMRGNTSTEVAGEETATILLPLLEDFPEATDVAGVALHEAFHVFQKRKHPSWGPGGMGLDNPVTEARLLALRRTETALLREALREADPDRARSHAAAALEVREERFSQLPPSIVRFERGIELLEGTAQHVQVTATGSRAGLRDLPRGGFAPEELHMRSYAVGLALTRLLERFLPGWETAVETEETVALGALLEDVAGDAAATDWRPVYAQELEEARRDVRRVMASRDSLRKEFLERPGPSVVLLASEASPLQPRGMDPMNLHVVAEDQVLHTRWLKLGHPTGTAEVLDRSALTRGAGGAPLRRGFLRVTLTGLQGNLSVREEGDEIVIRANGFQGRFHGAGVRRTGEQITVRLSSGSAESPS